MKPDFDIMTNAELQAYVLSHRDDEEAFYKLADRLTNSEPTTLYPCPDTPENTAIAEEAIRKYVEKLKEKGR